MASNHHAYEAGPASNHSRLELFTPIADAVLGSVDPLDVVKFRKERKRDELYVAANRDEIRTLRVTSYTASIDRSLLKHLVLMGAFNESPKMLP